MQHFVCKIYIFLLNSELPYFMFSFWKPNICKNLIRRMFLKKIKIPFLPVHFFINNVAPNFMNFYQSVFLEKIDNICKKVRFWGNYPLIFTLSDQNYDSKNCF